MLKKLTNKIRSYFIILQMAFVKSTNKVTNTDTSNDKSDTIVINESGTLLETLAKGEFNEQYVQQFYETLKASDKYYYSTDARVKNEDATKYGITINDETNDNDEYSESYKLQNHFDKTKKYDGVSLQDIIDKQRKERNLLTEDGLEVEYFFENEIEDVIHHNAVDIKVDSKKELEDYLETYEIYNYKKEYILEETKNNENTYDVLGITMEKIYKFHTHSDNETKNKMHEFANSVIIKKDDNDTRQLDFYFSNLMLRPDLEEYEDFIKTNKFSYTTKYGETLIYTITKFLELNVRGKNNILSFQTDTPKIILCTVDLTKLQKL